AGHHGEAAQIVGGFGASRIDGADARAIDDNLPVAQSAALAVENRTGLKDDRLRERRRREEQGRAQRPSHLKLLLSWRLGSAASLCRIASARWTPQLPPESILPPTPFHRPESRASRSSGSGR